MSPQVKVKLFRHGARLPEYAKPGDSGADLRWQSDAHVAVLQPDQTMVFWTGLGIELADGYEAQIRPRSSLSAKGILCALGTIDTGYRGELGITLTNNSRDMFRVERGDRIAQLVIAPVVQAAFAETDELSDSARGVGGWGSSGVK